MENRMKPEGKPWQKLNFLEKAHFVATLAVVFPYLLVKVSWYSFDQNNSKEIAVPKINFGYDIHTNQNDGKPSLYYFIELSTDYERRLFGIKREEFSVGGRGKGKSIEINSSLYLEEKVLEEHAPQIARVTYGMMPKNG